MRIVKHFFFGNYSFLAFLVRKLHPWIMEAQLKACRVTDWCWDFLCVCSSKGNVSPLGIYYLTKLHTRISFVDLYRSEGNSWYSRQLSGIFFLCHLNFWCSKLSPKTLSNPNHTGLQYNEKTKTECTLKSRYHRLINHCIASKCSRF